MEWFKSLPKKYKILSVFVGFFLLVMVSSCKVDAAPFPPKPDGAVFYGTGDCVDPETKVSGVCAIFVNADYQEGEPNSWLIFFAKQNDGELKAMYVVAQYKNEKKIIWVSPMYMAEE